MDFVCPPPTHLMFLILNLFCCNRKRLGSLRWYVTNSKKDKFLKKQYLNILKYVNSLNILLLISCILAVFFDFIAFF